MDPRPASPRTTVQVETSHPLLICCGPSLAHSGSTVFLGAHEHQAFDECRRLLAGEGPYREPKGQKPPGEEAEQQEQWRGHLTHDE